MKTYFIIFLTLNVQMLFGQEKINAKKPPESYPNVAYQIPISKLNIPIEMPLDSLEKQLNEDMKGLMFQISGVSYSDIDKFDVEVWKKSNITLKGQGDTLFTSAPLKILIQGKIEGNVLGIQLKNDINSEAEMLVNLKTQLSITPNWQIEAKTSLASYKWVKEPKLKIAIFEIPLGFVADQIISEQVKHYTQNIDEQIAKQISFKTQVAQAWKLLQEPYYSSEEYKLWLKFEPQKVYLTPLNFSNHKLSTNLLISTHSQAIQSEQKPAYVIKELPQQEVLEVPKTGFDMEVLAKISRAFLIKEMKQQIVGQEYTFKKKRKVKVNDIEIYGSAGKTAVALNLSGSIEGNVYLLGDLTYDEKKDKLYFANLDFDVDSKQKMLKFAAWLFKGKFKKNIQLVLDEYLSGYMTFIKKEVQKNLSYFEPQEGVVMRGQIEKLYISKVLMTQENILVFLPAKGKLQLNIFNFR